MRNRLMYIAAGIAVVILMAIAVLPFLLLAAGPAGPSSGTGVGR
ncbi:MAG TPA: hypothetical protein VIP28_03890 [Nocardioides sp.]